MNEDVREFLSGKLNDLYDEKRTVDYEAAQIEAKTGPAVLAKMESLEELEELLSGVRRLMKSVMTHLATVVLRQSELLGMKKVQVDEDALARGYDYDGSLGDQRVEVEDVRLVKEYLVIGEGFHGIQRTLQDTEYRIVDRIAAFAKEQKAEIYRLQTENEVMEGMLKEYREKMK